MPGKDLQRMNEHNNWANDLIIQACLSLSDEQLDAAAKSATMGTIRDTLFHMVESQAGYYRLLTLPVEERRERRPERLFNQLQESATLSGQALLNLVRDTSLLDAKRRLETTDGYWVEPWLVIVQVINHATEHREQIKSMLTAMGITPPDIDGWSYGEATHTLIPTEGRDKGG